MIDIEQRRLRTFKQDRFAARSSLIKEMTRVGNKWRETLDQERSLHNHRIRVEGFATVSNYDPIGIFEIALDAGKKHVRHQRIGDANPAAPSLVFIRRSDSPQSRSDFLITEPLLTRV